MKFSLHPSTIFSFFRSFFFFRCNNLFILQMKLNLVYLSRFLNVFKTFKLNIFSKQYLEIV